MGNSWRAAERELPFGAGLDRSVTDPYDSDEVMPPPVGHKEWPAVSPLLGNTDWIRDFERLVRRIATNLERLTRNYRHPGYPLGWEIHFTLRAFEDLVDHLNKVIEAFHEPSRIGGFEPFEATTDVLIAYQWAYFLAGKSILISRSYPDPSASNYSEQIAVASRPGRAQRLVGYSGITCRISWPRPRRQSSCQPSRVASARIAVG